MSLTLVTEPTRTVNNILSNVTAALSQVPLEFKRLDIIGKAVVRMNVGTAIAINFIDGDGSGLEDAELGDSYYLDFADTYVSGVYTGLAAFYPGGPPNGQVSFPDIQFIQNTTANVNLITARANYQVVIEILARNGVSKLVENAIRYRPNSRGELFVDLSGLIFAFAIQDIDVQTIIRYSEFYNETIVTTNQTLPIIGVLGRKQQLDDGGANMWEYLPNIQGRLEPIGVDDDSGVDPFTMIRFTPDEIPFDYVAGDFIEVDAPPYKFISEILQVGNAPTFKFLAMNPDLFIGGLTTVNGSKGQVSAVSGNFLTDFKEPRIWRGWNRSIGFVIDDNLFTRTGYNDITIRQQQKDRSGGLINTSSEVSNTLGVNQYELTKLTDPNTATTREVSMFFSPDIYLSKTIVFRELEACRNPIMVEWLNRRGSLEQHLFTVNQGVQDKSFEGLIFNGHTGTTLDLSNNDIGRLPFKEEQIITLLASDLTKNDIIALHSIKTAPHVTVWLDKTGEKTINVVVTNNLSTTYETDQGSGSFALTLRMPNGFNLFNNG